MEHFRDSMIKQLETFVAQNYTTSQKSRAYINYYDGLNVTTSFGHGAMAFVTWMSFTGDNQTTMEGIYPVVLYYRAISMLIIAYGVSSANQPKLKWSNEDSLKSIEFLFKEKKYDYKSKELKNYQNSFVYSYYDMTQQVSYENILDDLNSLIKLYKETLVSNSLSPNAEFAPSRNSSKNKITQLDPNYILEVKKMGKIKEPSYWIIPANNERFRIIDLFNDRTEVDWKQGNYKFKVGDICYLYNSKGYNRIIQKTEVVGVDISYQDSLEDVEYWVDKQDAVNAVNYTYFRLRLVSKLNLDDERLSSTVLKRLGISANFQGAMRVPNQKMIDYIEQVFNDETFSEDINVSPSNYWIYAPGEQACKWSDCTANQIMCIAWEELGDLTKYESREDMVKALKEAYGKPNASYMHDSLALWQFVHDMKPGDVIYAKKGVKNVIGRGVVMDEYVFDEEADNYNNIRKVKWTNVGNWKVNFDRQLPLKTLTRIDTNDQKFADDIEALFAEKKTDKQEPFDISSLISAIKSTNLIYDDKLIKRFAYSLLTKPFVILSGLAGSGKTQLALACAKALVEDVDSQICFVSVGADWTNREPLLGFPNALKDDVYQTPESGALQLMIEAEGNPEKPYFLILDEMNLSYVERYFADFLSAMEAKDMKIKLWDKDACGVPSSISLPKNLFIVGTINVDETTYMFSPKVLDRANVIEFKVSEEEMDTFLKNAPDVNMLECEGKAANMAKSFVEIAGGSKAISQDANDVLKKFFKELKTVNAEFGYRTATEIGRFISLATENGGMALNDAIDAAIVQKLLPKLHGSRKKIVKVLEPLFAECCCGKKIAELEEKDYAADVDGATYRLSADKILRMYNSAIENGFTSFAEA